MPILRPEREIFPDDFFSLPEEFRWGVAHVYSRQEKSLARELLRSDVPFYLPLAVSRRRNRAGRPVTSHIPIFPSYVFYRARAAQAESVRRAQAVVRIVPVRAPSELAEDLRQIRSLQAAGAEVVPYRPLSAGEAVKVTAGAFSGYTGVVVRDKAAERLVVSIRMLNQYVAVEFGRDVLQRIR